MKPNIPIRPDDQVIRKKGVVYRILDGQILLLRPGDPRPFRLNETGTRLWQMMERPARVADLIRRVANRYRIDTDRAAPDVTAFLADLMERRLITKETS